VAQYGEIAAAKEFREVLAAPARALSSDEKQT
jgi:hypothetical protein